MIDDATQVGYKDWDLLEYYLSEPSYTVFIALQAYHTDYKVFQISDVREQLEAAGEGLSKMKELDPDNPNYSSYESLYLSAKAYFDYVTDPSGSYRDFCDRVWDYESDVERLLNQCKLSYKPAELPEVSPAEDVPAEEAPAEETPAPPADD